jgi:hypothetical protein
MSQSLTFHDAVKRLYFGVNIFEASGSIVDTFEVNPFLRYNDTVIKQWDTNASIGMNSDEKALSARHVFSFEKSPIPELKIKSGQIVVTIRETTKTKKFAGIDWRIVFETEQDGEAFYKKLMETFSSLSTKEKTDYNPLMGYTSQYSTRNEIEKGIKDISIIFGKSFLTEDYQILLTLSNDFKFEDENRNK